MQEKKRHVATCNVADFFLWWQHHLQQGSALWAAVLMELIYQIGKWPVRNHQLFSGVPLSRLPVSSSSLWLPFLEPLMIHMTGASSNHNQAFRSERRPGLRYGRWPSESVAGWLDGELAAFTNQLSGGLFGFTCDCFSGVPTGRWRGWAADWPAFLTYCLMGCFWKAIRAVHEHLGILAPVSCNFVKTLKHYCLLLLFYYFTMITFTTKFINVATSSLLASKMNLFK